MHLILGTVTHANSSRETHSLKAPSVRKLYNRLALKLDGHSIAQTCEVRLRTAPGIVTSHVIVKLPASEGVAPD